MNIDQKRTKKIASLFLISILLVSVFYISLADAASTKNYIFNDATNFTLNKPTEIGFTDNGDGTGHSDLKLDNSVAPTTTPNLVTGSTWNNEDVKGAITNFSVTTSSYYVFTNAKGKFNKPITGTKVAIGNKINLAGTIYSIKNIRSGSNGTGNDDIELSQGLVDKVATPNLSVQWIHGSDLINNNLALDVGNGTGGNDSNTSMLLHFDNNLDNSALGRTPSDSTATSSDMNSFNYHYIYQSFSNGVEFYPNYIKYPLTDDVRFPDQFAIDFVFRPIQKNGIIASTASSAIDTTSWMLTTSAGKMHFYVADASNGIGNWDYDFAAPFDNSKIPIGNDIMDYIWHFAITRDVSNKLRMFINGFERPVSLSTDGGSTHDAGVTGGRSFPFNIDSQNNEGNFTIGTYTNSVTGSYSGDIDEFRISKGAPRWTTNFIPASYPYDFNSPNNYYTNTMSIDTSTWSAINSATDSKAVPANSGITYAVDFGSTGEYKIYTGSVWKSIVKNNSGTWQYYDNVSSAWQNTTDKNTALGLAVAQAANQMTSLAGATGHWGDAGGFDGTNSIATTDIAATLFTTGITTSPTISNIQFNYTPKTYFSDSPTISNTTGFTYDSLSAFSDTHSGSGSVQYQLSPDGSNWFYWNGTAWSSATLPTQYNDATTINTNLASFSAGTDFHFKAFLISDGTQDVVLNNTSVDYVVNPPSGGGGGSGGGGSGGGSGSGSGGGGGSTPAPAYEAAPNQKPIVDNLSVELNDAPPILKFTTQDPDNDNIKYDLEISDKSDYSNILVEYVSAMHPGTKTNNEFILGSVAGEGVYDGTYVKGDQNTKIDDANFYWRVKAIDVRSAESEFMQYALVTPTKNPPVTPTNPVAPTTNPSPNNQAQVNNNPSTTPNETKTTENPIPNKCNAFSLNTTIGKMDLSNDLQKFFKCYESAVAGYTFEWTAPENGTYIIDTNGSDSYMTVSLNIKKDSCDGKDIFAQDDMTGKAATLGLTKGEKIFLVFTNYNLCSSEKFFVNIAKKPTPQPPVISRTIINNPPQNNTSAVTTAQPKPSNKSLAGAYLVLILLFGTAGYYYLAKNGLFDKIKSQLDKRV